ncbi:MFS-type transporter SLC18B1 isoform X3 [Salmo salar]|uniref:MFS-type transporter SLC18B1 isoform X3 n=1 Tax=Salmo salar TaxID=8030 RepID=A0ABM3F8I8_SALSA|nr:MFS-type transporter SLC18B1 isoform X3 [Salmo salar]
MNDNMDSDEVQQTDGSALEESTSSPNQRMTRYQILTLMSIASVNFSSMICYSILGPFFPQEIVQIGAKFMLISGLFVSSVCTILFGLLDKVPDGATFIILCFIIRSVDAVGFSAAMTSSFAVSAKVFPNNIATVLGSLEIFTGLGLILGPPIGGWLYQSFGYEVPFMALGCFLFLMVPFNMYILPSFAADPSKDSFFRLFTHLKIVLICFAIFTLSSGLGFLDATLSIYAIDTFDLSPGYVGLLLLGLSLPYCLASPLLGIISDRFPSTRPWFMVLGGLFTATGFWFLGPVPILQIKRSAFVIVSVNVLLVLLLLLTRSQYDTIFVSSQLWLVVFMLGIIGFSLSMTAIPTFPEILDCAYENGFEEGLSTLGLVSGLFGAVWSFGMFCGPTLGGFITQQLSFEWAASVQGGLDFLAAFFLGVYFLCQRTRQERAPQIQNERPSDEATHLLT